MKYIVIALLAPFVFILGAIAHESDMANNCARDGNARAWFNEIKCEVKK